MRGLLVQPRTFAASGNPANSQRALVLLLQWVLPPYLFRTRYDMPKQSCSVYMWDTLRSSGRTELCSRDIQILSPHKLGRKSSHDPSNTTSTTFYSSLRNILHHGPLNTQRYRLERPQQSSLRTLHVLPLGTAPRVRWFQVSHLPIRRREDCCSCGERIRHRNTDVPL